jgi:hypothetical protein
MRVVRRVGYWVNDREEDRERSQVGRSIKAPSPQVDFPHPAAIIAALGARPPDMRVVHYLRNGIHADLWMGCSYCRLRCGVPDSEMGSFDLTDGLWLWPEGLAHYVEAHGLPLPEEFIATMKTNAWQPPVELSDTGDGKLDSQFWLEWGVRYSKGKLL